MSSSATTQMGLNDHTFGRVPMSPDTYAQVPLPPAVAQYQASSGEESAHLQMGDDGLDLDQRVRQIGEW